MSQSTLKEILIKSGTGILDGLFRTPVCLIAFDKYKYMIETKNALDSGNLDLSRDKEKIEEDFEKMLNELGEYLPLYEKMLANPVINFSNLLGEPMGTWNITKIHDPGSGESEGQYVITATSDGMEIEIDTDMIDLSGDYGTCQIRIKEPGKYLSFWEE